VLRQALQQLGWTEGYNSSGDSDLARRYARELVALAPDVILPLGSPNVRAVQQSTRTVPIVFAQVSDPVASGFVQSLAWPGSLALLVNPTAGLPSCKHVKCVRRPRSLASTYMS
jgi:ABC-type uncharacterized transport system substrate-binding protein